MTKTLEQIQEENRKVIIMANNPEAKTYGEALEVELGFGCVVLIENYDAIPIKDTLISYKKIDSNYCIGSFSVMSVGKEEVFSRIKSVHTDLGRGYKPIHSRWSFRRIIGKPLTLNRVLNSLPRSIYIAQSGNILLKIGDNDWERGLICEWDLRKETLEEQTEETQREINKLLK